VCLLSDFIFRKYITFSGVLSIELKKPIDKNMGL